MRSSRPPLIVIDPRHVIAPNGWFGHAESWVPSVQTMDTQAFTYAFTAQRGYGRCKGSGGPHTFAQFALHVLS